MLIYPHALKILMHKIKLPENTYLKTRNFNDPKQILFSQKFLLPSLFSLFSLSLSLFPIRNPPPQDSSPIYNRGNVGFLGCLVVAFFLGFRYAFSNSKAPVVTVTHFEIQKAPVVTATPPLSTFIGYLSTGTRIASFTMMPLSRVILCRYGWGVAAMITPTVLLVTRVAFFTLILFGQPLTPALAQIGMTPLLAAVYVGALENIFSESAKYSLFDPCKEMAYTPFNEETKFCRHCMLSSCLLVLVIH